VLAGRKTFALIAAVVVAGLGAASVAFLPDSRVARPAKPTPPSAPYAPTAGGASWQSIQAAASLRTDALRPNLTPFHRSFAAYMGLSTLLRLHHTLRGRCAVAVSYLYNNLLDLHDAYTGEDWSALRQAVATEPSLTVCAPRVRSQRPRVRYVE
jgi:hypothetical protein